MCDDQVTYNHVFFYDLNVIWDGGIETPNHAGALRIHAPNTENDGLLVESVTGRSYVTNHTIKIWDRDFAWRVSSSRQQQINEYLFLSECLMSLMYCMKHEARWWYS